MKERNKKTLGIVGLGYVGLPLTAAFASVGYRVIGIDIDTSKIKKLRDTYEPDIFEPGLSETLKRCSSKIEFTGDYAYLMENCDAIFITVGTPLKPDGNPNYTYLDSAIESIGKLLRKGQLIVLKSTVIPGTTENHVTSKLEEKSGLKAGVDFYVAFSPERTIEGLALHELYTLPKIIGGIDSTSTEYAASVIKKLGGDIIKVTSPTVAEICKLSDNLYRAMNIAFANEIGELCEKLGIDAYEVVSAVNNAYERTHLYKPGLGADGPCLSKDPEIFRFSLQKAGMDSTMTSACIDKNTESTLRITSIISEFLNKQKIENPRISLLGLAFKGFPQTDDVRGSPALKIRNSLINECSEAEFRYYDPILKDFMYGPMCNTVEECIQGSHVVAFLTNSPSLMNIDIDDILNITDRPLLIVDSWHNITLKKTIKHEKVKIFRVGAGYL
jgi:nucleotide sugar dehydrogenase